MYLALDKTINRKYFRVSIKYESAQWSRNEWIYVVHTGSLREGFKAGRLTCDSSPAVESGPLRWWVYL